MAGDHDAREVANRLIAKGLGEGRTFTHLQVMKLVYFAHGWTLGFYHRPLFYQQVEAWQYGPVVRDVYDALKQHRGRPIDTEIPGVESIEFYSQEIDVVEQVYDVYGKLSGVQLSAMTHQEGTPWGKTIEARGQGAIIPNSLIEEYFGGLVSE